jgi:hypothetical protein
MGLAPMSPPCGEARLRLAGSTEADATTTASPGFVSGRGSPTLCPRFEPDGGKRKMHEARHCSLCELFTSGMSCRQNTATPLPRAYRRRETPPCQSVPQPTTHSSPPSSDGDIRPAISSAALLAPAELVLRDCQSTKPFVNNSIFGGSVKDLLLWPRTSGRCGAGVPDIRSRERA